MAKGLTKVLGVQEALRQLAFHRNEHQHGVERGLKKAGLFVQRQSQTIVPVDTGHLKNSAFTRHTGKGFTTQVIVGYTADYAVYVHEDLTKAHGAEYNSKYAYQIAMKMTYYVIRDGKRIKRTYSNRGENQQAKYLEAVIRKHRRDVIRIVAREAKKGLGA